MGNSIIKNPEPDISESSSGDGESETEQSDSNSLSFSNDRDGAAMECDSNLRTDAIDLVTHNGFSSMKSITLSDVGDIETNLNEDEKISLIFLLSDDVQDCLGRISLYNWAQRQLCSNNNWQQKLIEAMAIIKNFQVPKKFGITKDWLIKVYFPFTYFSTTNVSKFKKTLYCICEELCENDEKRFLEYLIDDLNRKHLKVEQFTHLELYFSFLLKIGYIKENDVRNLKQIFKKLEFDLICDMLDLLPMKNCDNSLFQMDQDILFPMKSCDKTKVRTRTISVDDGPDTSGRYLCGSFSDISNSTQDNTFSIKDSSFNRDSDNIYDNSGNRVALIIDQENFYTEIQEKYKHLLPPNRRKEMLHERVGTAFDSRSMEASLKRRNFQVTVKRNRTHLQMVNDLREIVGAIDGNNCSCLFVAIFSHGDEGVIYGCNSCYVEVSAIIKIMAHSKLMHKPKVLILQSCQGPGLQVRPAVRSNQDLDVDGNCRRVDFKDPDFVIFWSTVAGFASVRDKKRGSWFIQSLCKQLDQSENEHLLDICTKIKREVLEMRWKENSETECYMVPVLWTTFSRKLYFH